MGRRTTRLGTVALALTGLAASLVVAVPAGAAPAGALGTAPGAAGPGPSAPGPSVPGHGGAMHAGLPPGTAGGQATVQAAPPGYTTTGIDVSSWQGVVNWSQVVAGGASFAYAKATEGVTYLNPYFDGQYNGAKGAGLYTGAYAFGRPDAPNPVAQADFFVDHAQFVHDGRTLPLLLDVEWPYSDGNGGYVAPYPCWGLTPAAMVSWIRAFVNEVQARTARKVLIYTNRFWWDPCTGSDTSFGDQLLDVAHYASTPPAQLPAGWSNWTFWQYSASGTLPGAQDVFNGSLTELANLAGTVAIASGWTGPDSSVFLADLGGDGRTELISKEDGILYAFRNNGYASNGTVFWGGKVGIASGWTGPDSSMYLADLNGDGRAELVSKENGILYAFRNYGYNANGTVSWGGKVGIASGWTGPDSSVYFGDLDGDGRAEVISNENGILYAFRNYGYNANGTVNWGGKVQVASGFTGPDSSVYVTDLGGDRRAELVSKEDGTLYGFRNYGYNANGTVVWGGKSMIGGGRSVPDRALLFADLNAGGGTESISKLDGVLYNIFHTQPG